MRIMQYKEGFLSSGIFTDDFDTFGSFWTDLTPGVGTIAHDPTAEAMKLTIPAAAAAGGPFMTAGYVPTGDFDIRVKIDGSAVTAADFDLQSGFQVKFGANRYNLMLANDDQNGPYPNTVRTWTNEGGSTWWFNDVNYDANRNVELRMARVGSTMTSYYRKVADGSGAAWVTGSTVNVGTGTTEFISFYAYHGGPSLAAEAVFYHDDISITGATLTAAA